MVRLILVLLLLTGCAGVRAVTPYTSDAIERSRAMCLGAGGIWMESTERATCMRQRDAEPEREERT